MVSQFNKLLAITNMVNDSAMYIPGYNPQFSIGFVLHYLILELRISVRKGSGEFLNLFVLVSTDLKLLDF